MLDDKANFRSLHFVIVNNIMEISADQYIHPGCSLALPSVAILTLNCY